MKKFYAVLIAVFTVFCFATAALAADMVIEKKINQIVYKTDKNGNPYARIIVSEQKTLNGVTYNKDVSVMAFGDMYKEVKASGLKKGDTLKGVASQSEFRGGVSYQLLALTK